MEHSSMSKRERKLDELENSSDKYLIHLPTQADPLSCKPFLHEQTGPSGVL